MRTISNVLFCKLVSYPDPWARDYFPAQVYEGWKLWRKTWLLTERKMRQRFFDGPSYVDDDGVFIMRVDSVFSMPSLFV